MKKRNIRTLIYPLSALIIAAIIAIAVNAAPNTNGSRLALGSELTYYLKVKYDGIDKKGTTSSDTKIVRVNSDIIEVSDRLPDGLTFKDFTKISQGVFNATKRDGAAQGSCAGVVVDDTNDASYTTGTWNSSNTEYTYHGLHYNKNTNEVTFKVKNLTAGCQISIGIVTTVPNSADDPTTIEKETRKDFYNTATIKDGDLFNRSNTLHNYILEDLANDDTETISKHKVKYEYKKDACKVLGTLPNEVEYIDGTEVLVEQDIPNQETMKFKGWTTTDVTLTNGKFTMPNKDVTFTGDCEEIIIPKYKVTYEIEGDTPEGFILPYEKEYKENDLVTVDSLNKGTEYNGYEFLGWSTTDVTISNENDFEMPNKDITIKGKFKLITYKVTYEFTGDIPTNASSLLPEEKQVTPNTTITPLTIEDQGLYIFLGWNKEEFQMPNEDVVIKGEWMKVTGKFTPEIKIEILDKKDEYKKGEKIKYQVTVTNNADFDIYDIIINQLNLKIVFPDTLNKQSDNSINIDKINAKDSYVFTYEYTVDNDDKVEIKNTVELFMANALDNYILEKPEEGIVSSVTAKIKVEEEKPIPIIDDIPKVIGKIAEISATFDPIGRYIMLFCISTLGIGIALYKLKKDKKFKMISLTSVFLLILTGLMSYHGTVTEQSVFTSLSNTFFSPNSYSEYIEAIREVSQEDEDNDLYTITKEAYWTGKNEATLKIKVDPNTMYTDKWDRVIVGTDVSNCQYDIDKTFASGEDNNYYQIAVKELLDQIDYEYDSYQTFTYNGLTTENDNKNAISLDLRDSDGRCKIRRTQSNYGMDLFNAIHTAVNGKMTYGNFNKPNYIKSEENILILLIDSGESYISDEEDRTVEECDFDGGGCGGGEMDGGGGGNCGSGSMTCNIYRYRTNYLQNTKKLIKEYFPNATIISVRNQDVDNGRNYPKHFADDKYTTWESSYKLLNDHYIKGMADPLTFDLDDLITDAFSIDDIKSITSNYGTVKLTKENNNDKIIWNFTNRASTERYLTIKLKLNDEYKESDLFLPTNTVLHTTHKLASVNSPYTNTMAKTPVLSHMYNVVYDNNAPSGCSLENIASERHIVYDTVAIKDKELSCDGYTFKGWEIVDDDVNKVTDNSFVMPEKDVIIRAIWGTSSITKTFETSGFNIILDAVGGYFTDEDTTTNILAYQKNSNTGNMETSDVYVEPVYGCFPYAFDGWYKDTSYTQKVEITDFSSLDQTIKLYAKWKTDSKYIAASGNAADSISALISSETQDLIMADDPDSNPRYIGKCPNNYISFNGELWRIVGVFNNSGKMLKIVRDESIGSYSWDSDTANGGNGINEWSQADIKKLLNEGAYWNRTSGTCYNAWSNSTTACDFSEKGFTSNAKSMIQSTTWYTASTLGSTYYLMDARLSSWYANERSSYHGKVSGRCGSYWCNDSVSRTTRWTGNVALLSPSDILYSGAGTQNITRSECLNAIQFSDQDCRNNSWLKDYSMWTLNPGRAQYGYVIKYSNGYLYAEDAAAGANEIYPSVFLKNDTVITGGIGTKTNPYTIGR